jgi:hypothetical protein
MQKAIERTPYAAALGALIGAIVGALLIWWLLHCGCPCTK